MTDVMQMSQSYSQYSNLYAYQQQVCSSRLLASRMLAQFWCTYAFLSITFLFSKLGLVEILTFWIVCEQHKV